MFTEEWNIEEAKRVAAEEAEAKGRLDLYPLQRLLKEQIWQNPPFLLWYIDTQEINYISLNLFIL